MAAHRRNPTALENPKLSVVIPVYNERPTIEEIIRRVVDTTMRKEIIVVDDCSTDGTRQILEQLAARQSEGQHAALASDGGDPVELGELTIFFQSANQG